MFAVLISAAHFFRAALLAAGYTPTIDADVLGS